MNLFAWPGNFPSINDFSYGSLIPSFSSSMSSMAQSSGGGQPFPFNYGAPNTYNINASINVLTSSGLSNQSCGDFTFPANLCPANDAAGQPPAASYYLFCAMEGESSVKIGGAWFKSNTNEDPISGDFDEWWTVLGATLVNGVATYSGNALYYHRFSDLTNDGTLQSTTGAPIYGGAGFAIDLVINSPNGLIFANTGSIFDPVLTEVPYGKSPVIGNANGLIYGDGLVATSSIATGTAGTTGMSDGTIALIPGDTNYYNVVGGISVGGPISDLGLEGVALTAVSNIGGDYYAAMAYLDGGVVKSKLYKSATLSGFVEEPIMSPDNSLAFINTGEWYMAALWSESNNIFSVIMDSSNLSTAYGASSIGGKIPRAVYPSHYLAPLPSACIPLCEENP